jgi:hypothetical protein
MSALILPRATFIIFSKSAIIKLHRTKFYHLRRFGTIRKSETGVKAEGARE